MTHLGKKKESEENVNFQNHLNITWDNKLLFYSQNCHYGTELLMFVFLNSSFSHLKPFLILLNFTLKLYGLQ